MKTKIKSVEKADLIKRENILRETFNTFKFKKSIQEVMEEIDEELS